MSIEDSSYPVPLMTLKDVIRKEMPGVQLRESLYGDIELVLYLSSRSSGAIAANQEMAEFLMKALMERLRLEAIHQLGLEPQLNAWRDQVNTYRDENSTLSVELARLRAVLAGGNAAEVDDE